MKIITDVFNRLGVAGAVPPTELSQSYHFNGVGDLECCFFVVSFFIVKMSFMSRSRAKCILGTVKLHGPSWPKNFFLQFFRHGVSPGYSEMICPSGVT